MQHIQCGINSLSKFTIARHLPLLEGTLKHIIFPVPSLRPASPSFTLMTARASDSALRLAMRVLQMIVLYHIVLYCTVSYSIDLSE